MTAVNKASADSKTVMEKQLVEFYEIKCDQQITVDKISQTVKTGKKLIK